MTVGHGTSAAAATVDARSVDTTHVTSMRGEFWRRLRRNKLAVAGLGLIGLVVFAAIFADVIARQPVSGFFPTEARQGPSPRHWFGTDTLGRDLFSRVVHGARLSLIVGGAVTGMILVLGLTVGGVAGYFGGAVDAVLSRLLDIFLAFPFLIGAIIVATALGRGLLSIVIAIAFFSWATVARLFRGSVIAVRDAEYVEAARALGAAHLRIFFRHVLPNAVVPTLVYAFALVGTTIVAEAALSFLGLGISEPEPSWGLMIAKGRTQLRTEPQMVLFPSIALSITAMGFILLGDGLRDSLDPRLR